MREYETTFIVQPEISDEGVEALCQRLEGILEKSDDASRLFIDDMGRRRLSYEIRNFQKGQYLTLFYLDEGKVVPEIERALRLDDSVLRFLTVLASDDVVDVEARKAEAAEIERVRAEKAAERAAREAEEAAERAAREAEEAARAAEEAARAAAEAAAQPEEQPVEAEGPEGSQAAEPEAKAEPEAEPEPEAKAKPKAEPEAKAEPKAEPEADAEPKQAQEE